MSILICLPCAIFEISSVIFSISAPLRPITMPGRAVWMVTRMEFHARSITIFATAANCSFFFTSSRIFRSLCRNEGNSCGEAYQRERQSRFTFRRNPIGLTFCPISLRRLFLRFSSPLRLRRFSIRHSRCAFCYLTCSLFVCRPLFGLPLRFSRLSRLDGDLVRKHDANVTGALQNPTGTAASARHDPLQRRSFAHGRFLYHQTVWFEVRVVLGVGDCAL